MTALRSLYLNGSLGDACSRRFGLEPVPPDPFYLRAVDPAPPRSGTFCCHGHRLTDANTYTRPNGVRDCKTCRRLGDRRRKAA